MKVKVRDQIYDAEAEPVMVILTPKDKENITSMRPELTKYCEHPATYSDNEIAIWMEEVS